MEPIAEFVVFHVRRRQGFVEAAQLEHHRSFDRESPRSKVSLENPNWVILIEILAENTGISIVKESDIVSLEREKRALSE